MMESAPTLDEIVGTIGRLYGSYGLSPPFDLRRAAAGWTNIPLTDIIDAIELHFLHHRRLYNSGSGDAYFSLVQRAVSELRNKQLFAGDAAPSRTEARPARGERGGVRKLPTGAGHIDAYDDRDDSEVLPQYARPGASQPQPFSLRQERRVTWEGIDGDDDPADD